MFLEEYEKEVSKTAIYPHSGEKNMFSTIYPGLGLTGESGEVADKVADLLTNFYKGKSFTEADKEGILYELGDVLWYVVRILHEIDKSVEDLQGLENNIEVSSLEVHALRICAASGRINDHFKKSLRDDEVDFNDELEKSRKNLIFKEVAYLYFQLSIFSEWIGYNINEVFIANVSKLENRVKNKTIKGEGDYR